MRLVEDPPNPRRDGALRERLREGCRERTLIDELLLRCAELQGRDARTAVRVDQDVLGLEVAIEETGLMRRRESFARVDEQPDDLAPWMGARKPVARGLAA